MNSKITDGKWTEFRGLLKEKWGKLTDDDLEITEGNIDQIAGKIKSRYGHELSDIRKSLNSVLETINKKIK